MGVIFSPRNYRENAHSKNLQILREDTLGATCSAGLLFTSEFLPGNSLWEKLGIFLESLGGSQRQLCIKTRPILIRKLEKAVAVSGVCSGVLEENSGKIAGKFLPESRNATIISRISGTGKGKPAGNLGPTLPGPCPHLPCGVFSEIDSSSLLEFS